MRLSVRLLGLLNDQYRHETANALRYTSRASLSEFRGLTGTASFFAKQAAGERDHSEIVYKIINDRNAMLEPSPFGFNEPLGDMQFPELFTSSLIIEENTTTKLNEIAQTALAEGDYQTFSQIQSLIVEQVEESNIIQTILDRITVISSLGPLTGEQIHLVDVWIGGL